MSTELATIFIGIVVLIVLVTVSIRVGIVETRSRVLWRVEAKLDLLLQSADIQFDPNSLPADVTDAIRRGEKVRAIRSYRDATGAPLKQATAVIDDAMRRRS